MNIKKFKRHINMGLGSAILELKKNPGCNEKYKDAVLYACLHNTRYDAQNERVRDRYLFEVIDLIGDRDYFEQRIVQKLNRSEEFFLNIQLCWLLFQFWKNGSENAVDALQKKFDLLISKLPHITRYNGRNTPDQNAEEIAIVFLEIRGIRSFYDAAQKFGSVLRRTKREEALSISSFWSEAKDKFGKARLLRGLEKRAKKSQEIKCFLDLINLEFGTETEEIHWRGPKTVQDFLDAVESKQLTGIYWFIPRTTRNLSAEERAKIAQKIDGTDDPQIKKTLLRVFRYIDYPDSVDKLLAIYNEGDDELKEKALIALARFKDPRIHDLAVYNLEKRFYIHESLGLLEKNLQGEYSLVLNILKSHRDSEGYDYHYLTMAITDVFRKSRNPRAKEILLFDYYRNRCVCCRQNIVATMCRSKCIPADVLEECLYDCNESIRKIAARYKRRYSTASH